MLQKMINPIQIGRIIKPIIRKINEWRLGFLIPLKKKPNNVAHYLAIQKYPHPTYKTNT